RIGRGCFSSILSEVTSGIDKGNVWCGEDGEDFLERGGLPLAKASPSRVRFGMAPPPPPGKNPLHPLPGGTVVRHFINLSGRGSKENIFSRSSPILSRLKLWPSVPGRLRRACTRAATEQALARCHAEHHQTDSSCR